MAAILCKPIGSCFELICTAPCKLCAVGCKLCSDGCKLCSDGMAGVCTNPLSAFVALTLTTQIPVAIAAALELGGQPHPFGCKAGQWLAGMLAAAIAHAAAGVYLARRVANRTDEALRSRHSASNRISYLLCHDAWIALYLSIVLFFAAWLCVGSGWSLGGRMHDSSDCGPDSTGRVGIVLGLGWFYLFAGPTVLSCSMCCGCCDRTDYVADDAAFAAKAAKKEAKKRRYGAANDNTAANDGADIETPDPSPPLQPQTMPAAKKVSSQPMTSSSDGIPIVKAYVVMEEDVLPPPVPPPSLFRQKTQGE